MFKKTLGIIFLFILIAIASAYLILNPEKNEINKTTRITLGGTYIKLTDGFTHYRLQVPAKGSGKKKLVVLIHGGTIPMWTWDKQAEALKNAGFRVLTYDQYGRGYSDRPDITYDQALYKRQLSELLTKLNIVEPFDLIGLSLGGGTAVNFTAHNPEKIKNLILISPVICNFKISGVFKIPILGEFIARIAGVRVIVKRFKSLFENNIESDKYTKLFIEQTTYKGFEKSILSMLRNDALGDYTASYKKVGDLKIKTLLVWGKRDTEITKEMINKIKDFIPNLDFKPIDDAGHGIVFQKSEGINKLILDFL
jgi:pimeloyl-ACP methyl ester carboxylesterase